MTHLVVRVWEGGWGSGLPLERVASFTHCHPTITPSDITPSWIHLFFPNNIYLFIYLFIIVIIVFIISSISIVIIIIIICDYILFVLRFYGPVNPMWSVYLTTRLVGRLSPLSG